jgi:cyclic beta-1,2-glucan synthetase
LTDDCKARLGHVRYVIALDEDTSLTADSARELIGTITHPRNSAIIDPVSRVVTRGHGILQPRVATELRVSAATAFARAFSGGGGHDIYGGARSETYQAVSGKSPYIGKGIIDVDAYLICLDGRFPNNHVLSHDLLEGAYLCCGSAHETELSDGFPRSTAPYYERLHRWTRGDWQNAPWLFPRVKTASGESERNPLSAIDKWLLFDNLRRSLLPPCAFALIIAGAVSTRLLPEACIAALSLVFGHALSALRLPRRGKALLRRRFAFVPESFGGRLFSAAARLLLLPIEASVCVSAAATALFRMIFTKRRMLQWVTAASAEKLRRRDGARCLLLGLPGIAAALTAAALSWTPPAILAAAVWALSPLAAARMGRREAEKPDIPACHREYLVKAARGAYRYFTDFMTPESHFLPPDNYQPSRPDALAYRTSPTNIGLALLAPIAAAELGIVSRGDALRLSINALKSAAALEKWRGHLFNWYDVRTLSPLPPRFVSTVDSGNFAACLIALRRSLKEYGDEYGDEYGATEAARLADELCNAMDFAALYDEKRHLFHIGFDAYDGLTESVYDLFSSEAMLTSYLAAARGDVPVRHWRALSRAPARAGAYRGMVSWTGTMFEYLLPMLFLPYPPGSLLRESADVCVYAHKKAARGGPWGCSESVYGETDESGGFLYKAHGAPQLSLRHGARRAIWSSTERSQTRENVTAPYASFLALELDPRGAVRNLKSFEKLGAFGEYGFCDAVDSTRPLHSYMAHHLGMSLIAAANYLNDGVFRRRFMSCRETAAYEELLGERWLP